MQDESRKGLGRGSGQRRNKRRQGRSGRDMVVFAAPGEALMGGAATVEVVDGDGAKARIIAVCVDDTDDLSGGMSTGAVAERMAQMACELGGRILLGITRHQLLLAEGVPYTSHNSSMAFMAKLPEEAVPEFHECAPRIVREMMAASSDPGLCIAVLPERDDARDGAQRASRELASAVDALAAFGRRAQSIICTKEEAYGIAAGIPWVHLSEHGGTGDGVIGALAGVGLRLGGADGRFRGEWDLPYLIGRTEEGAVPCASLVSVLSQMVSGPVKVRDPEGRAVQGDELVALIGNAKPILQNGALTFVADAREGGVWMPRSGKEATLPGICVPDVVGCPGFVWDNDVEECASDADERCESCLWRRWTMEGFSCVSPDGALIQKGVR